MFEFTKERVVAGANKQINNQTFRPTKQKKQHTKQTNKQTNKTEETMGVDWDEEWRGLSKQCNSDLLEQSRHCQAATGSVKSIYWKEKQPTAFGLSQVLRRGRMPPAAGSSKLWTLPTVAHFSLKFKKSEWGQTKRHDVQQITRSSSFIFRNLVALFSFQFVIQI